MMPDSPVFPGDFSVQENLGISQPSLPFPCCRPGQSLVAPHTQPPALAACPHSRQPAGSRAGRRTHRGAHVHGSPTCRISQRIRVSWMLLRAKGHSCLSSRLLFSRTNWRRGSLPCVMGATDSEGELYPPSRAIPYRSPPKNSPSLLLPLLQYRSRLQAQWVGAWQMLCSHWLVLPKLSQFAQK